MQRVAKAFEQGDLDSLFSAIDENIVWKSAVTKGGPFNFGGINHKTDGVIELMSEITTEYFSINSDREKFYPARRGCGVSLMLKVSIFRWEQDLADHSNMNVRFIGE